MKTLFTLVITLLFLSPSSYAIAPFDWSEFDSLLKQHVKAGEIDGIEANLVDYKAFKQSKSFYQIADKLAGYDPTSLETKRKLVFYINAYNYFTIKLVADNYPLESIKDLGNFLFPVWKKDVGKINGKVVSLDHIEHDVLRKLGEPGIHFAIVCASLSCPDLRAEAYNEEYLQQQISDQTRRFLQQSKGMQIKRNGSSDELYLSKIFQWFESDFIAKGGVISYLSEIDPSLKEFEEFETIDYNWQVNAQP